MRRKDREIVGVDNFSNIAKEGDVLLLAFNGDEFPYILPLNYGCELKDNTLFLYFHSALEGNKYNYLYDGANISFEIDCKHELVVNDKNKCSLSMKYKSIIGKGTIKELKTKDEIIPALDLIVSQYLVSNAPYNDAILNKTRVFQIQTFDIIGKAQV
ncbi:pyridoxamine 5'-phosphate oxidase family protein [Miniphocaeibacter massiliensis]|uniref:pyridoxamine 5'-phosphate oxidase family protein n=1 Tax=Miniphocaeibacter massiliensis TaxID=2041841 RepID=UPI000C1BB22E|nr:pyridoxamine 5'-phosphate oxidase family protein [Miniphocaeibacter massiliensis]